jgi:hypothetical protein
MKTVTVEANRDGPTRGLIRVSGLKVPSPLIHVTRRLCLVVGVGRVISGKPSPPSPIKRFPVVLG